MEYTNFKNACNYQDDLIGSLRVNQQTLFFIQRMFESSRNSFFLSGNYSSALWYETLLSRFKNDIENDSLNSSERLISCLSIYKALFIKYNTIKRNSLSKMREINDRNDFLSHTA